MVKIISAILCGLLMLFALASCGPDNGNDASSSSDSSLDEPSYSGTISQPSESQPSESEESQDSESPRGSIDNPIAEIPQDPDSASLGSPENPIAEMPQDPDSSVLVDKETTEEDNSIPIPDASAPLGSPENPIAEMPNEG